MSTTHYDVIVIGGGASGMMAAGKAAERGRRVLLLEKNTHLGEKLKITGGGRCNITNAEEDEQVLLSYYGDGKPFLHSPFSQFGMKDTFAFFESRGLPLVVQGAKRGDALQPRRGGEGKRAFPKSEKATDVYAVMEKYLREGGVQVRTGAGVEKIVGGGGNISGVIVGGETLTATSYILATGGKSHPETGSTGDGFRWLQELGHAVKEPTPTIVPLAVADAWVKQLAGVALKGVRITFFLDGSKRLALKGDVLCTHFGLSGPLILNAAGTVADMLHAGQVTAEIDVYPSEDVGALDRRITTIFDDNKNKLIKNALGDITPPGTGQAILPLLEGVRPDTKVHSITKEQRRIIVDTLKALPVSITGLMGYDRAVVADGGVALAEIDTRTMASKLYRNLFVTGDLLHISRPSGGYSLQLCWTTGFVAGSHA